MAILRNFLRLAIYINSTDYGSNKRIVELSVIVRPPTSTDKNRSTNYIFLGEQGRVDLTDENFPP